VSVYAPGFAKRFSLSGTHFAYPRRGIARLSLHGIILLIVVKIAFIRLLHTRRAGKQTVITSTSFKARRLHLILFSAIMTSTTTTTTMMMMTRMKMMIMKICRTATLHMKTAKR